MRAAGEVEAPGPRALATGWLRSADFDLGLLAGVLALALAAGAAASARPGAFVLVLTLDFWLLAGPHVASTFTRIAFDRPSAREHWFLLAGLPPLVLLGTGGVAWLGGAVALNSLYYYWQTWHYARQSQGVARAYRRSAGAAPGHTDTLTAAVLFGFPAWGLLHRAHQARGEFYGLPLWTPAVPKVAVVVGAIAALAALSAWAVRLWSAAAEPGFRGTGHALLVLSHVAITVVSYVAIDDPTRGWLFINVWHNAQYLLFVWARNAAERGARPDPARPFLAWLSRPRHAPAYVAACLGLSTLFYLGLGRATAPLSSPVLPLFVVAHLAVNFHHYVVDAVIWRSRAKAAPIAPIAPVAAPA